MKLKLLMALIVMLASGFPFVINSTCVDSQVIEVTSSINEQTYNSTYICDYGCDMGMNRCRQPSNTNLPVTSVIMLVFFFAGLVIFLLKLYSLLSMATVYDRRMTVLTMVVGLIAWVFVFGITIINVPVTVWSTGYAFDLLVLNFATVVMVLTVFFSAIELLMQHTALTVSHQVGLRRKI